MHPITVDRDVLTFMARHGGQFSRLLAAAWLTADAKHSARLAQTFGDLYAKYESFKAEAEAVGVAP
jgi:hypothetical protein